MRDHCPLMSERKESKGQSSMGGLCPLRTEGRIMIYPDNYTRIECEALKEILLMSYGFPKKSRNELFYKGVFTNGPKSCLLVGVCDTPGRWAISIHGMLHSISAAYLMEMQKPTFTRNLIKE